MALKSILGDFRAVFKGFTYENVSALKTEQQAF